jgi:hypothetical protein
VNVSEIVELFGRYFQIGINEENLEDGFKKKRQGR